MHPSPNYSASVLVLDDDPQICNLITRYLKSYYNVACFTDTAAALKSVIDNPPDLVFVDIHLGYQDLNGISFAWRLREKKYDGIICMLSGDRTQETALSALIAGADEYLVKSEIAGTIRTEVELLLAPKRSNNDIKEHIRTSGRLRSEGLSSNQRALLADWATAGMPDLPDLSEKYEISIQALSKRFARIQEKLGLENRSQLSSLITTVMGFGARENLGAKRQNKPAGVSRP